jgi:hypothetical protein
MSLDEDVVFPEVEGSIGIRLHGNRWEAHFSSGKHSISFFFFANGNLAARRSFSGGKQEGIEQLCSKKGVTHKEIYWANGTKLEEREWSCNNGMLLKLEKFRGNNWSKELVQWQENGGLRAWSKEIESKDGRLHGRKQHKTWYENLAEKEVFETDPHGERDGVSLVKYQNGLLCKKQEFRNGINHGAFVIWDDTGNVLVSNVYVNGSLFDK